MQCCWKILLGAVGGLMSVLLFEGKIAGAEAGPAMNIETIKIRNEVCEAEITTEPFVHLLGLRFLGAKNHLLNYETPNPLKNGKPIRPLFIVGAKLWYAPEITGSAKFGMLTGDITQKRNEVDVKLKPDPDSGLQGQIQFVLDEHRAELTISSSITNVGKAARETSCWWPVSFEPGGKMEAVPIPSPTEPIFSYHFWSYGGTASEPACKIEKDRVQLDLDRTLNPPIFKIGFIGREIVLRKPDCIFRLTAIDPPVDAQGRYPHGNSPVMLYCDQRSGFCEAELSGPLAVLQPDQATSLTFKIALDKPSGR
jgi:hypothetical protein